MLQHICEERRFTARMNQGKMTQIWLQNSENTTDTTGMAVWDAFLRAEGTTNMCLYV